MKQVLPLLLFFVIISCSEEDDCDCHYAEEFNQYIPNTLWHENFTRLTQERMDALASECRVQGCK